MGLTLFEICKEDDFVYFIVDLYPLLAYLAWIFLSNILNPDILVLSFLYKCDQCTLIELMINLNSLKCVKKDETQFNFRQQLLLLAQSLNSTEKL